MKVLSPSPWQQFRTSRRWVRSHWVAFASRTAPSGDRVCSQCPCSSFVEPGLCFARCPPWRGSRWMPYWGLHRRFPWTLPPPTRSCAGSARVVFLSRALQGFGATRTPGCPLVVLPLRHCICRCSWLSEGVCHCSQRGRAWIQHGSASSAQLRPVKQKNKNKWTTTN